MFRQKIFEDENGESITPGENDIPYERIDVIFNARNMWANFQNPHPNFIFYNLHRETQWKPLIFDTEFDKSKVNQKQTKRKKGSDSEGDSSEGNH